METKYFTSKWAAFIYYYLALLMGHKARRPFCESNWSFDYVWVVWVD